LANFEEENIGDK